MIEKIKSIDLQFFHALRSYSVSKTSDKLLRFYIYMGDGYVWALFLAYLAIFESLNKMIEVLKAVFPVAMLSLVVYHVIKLSLRRKRPYVLLPDVTAKISPMDKFSFPSGHTMNNLTVSLGLINYFQQTSPIIILLLIFMPLSWGVLRIYYGLHWLSDVLAGIVLAILCFLVGFLLFP